MRSGDGKSSAVDRKEETAWTLPHLHGVDHFDEGGEVLFLNRRFVVDIPDERRVEQRFRLAPEVIAGFPVALRVGNEGRDQLQNVLFRVEIREGVVVVGLFEVETDLTQIQTILTYSE